MKQKSKKVFWWLYFTMLNLFRPLAWRLLVSKDEKRMLKKIALESNLELQSILTGNLSTADWHRLIGAAQNVSRSQFS